MNIAMLMSQLMTQASQMTAKTSGNEANVSGKEGFASLLEGLTSGSKTIEDVTSQLSVEGMEELEVMLQQLLQILESGENVEESLADWFSKLTDQLNLSDEEMANLFPEEDVGESPIGAIGMILTELYQQVMQPKRSLGHEQLNLTTQNKLATLQKSLETLLMRFVQMTNKNPDQSMQSSTNPSESKWQSFGQLLAMNPSTQSESDFVKELQRLVKDSNAQKPSMNWLQALIGTSTKSVQGKKPEVAEQFSLLLRNSPQLNQGQSVTQSSPVQNHSQQMMNQIEQMVLSTRFSKPGGATQLTLQLKPAELGDMILKFTRINGEMTVKITVMNQAAKEMLEKNLHQLRHLFSPNQVVIERQADPTNEANQSTLKEKDEEPKDQSSGQQRDGRQSDPENESEVTFEDYLFKEEV